MLQKGTRRIASNHLGVLENLLCFSETYLHESTQTLHLAPLVSLFPSEKIVRLTDGRDAELDEGPIVVWIILCPALKH